MPNPDPLPRDAYRRLAGTESNTGTPYVRHEKLPARCICGNPSVLRLPTDERVCTKCAEAFYRELVEVTLTNKSQGLDTTLTREFNEAMAALNAAEIELEQHVRRG